MKYQLDFTHADGTEPHFLRTREIIKLHPEVKQLMTKNPMTFAWIFGCVAFQVIVAYFIREQSWWLVLAAAWLIGAFPTHTLFVCVHEAAHNLIFKKGRNNVFAGIFANLPQLLPSAITFKNFHLKHHAFQGVHELDCDLPGKFEARLIRNYSIGKMIWMFLFPVFQVFRTIRAKEVAVVDRWVLLNIAVQFTFDILIWYFFGWKAITYLGMSFMFSVGLHPLGGRIIQEHFLVLDPTQETYSYYGIMNGLNMNVGFHNEHHDMPSIPWNNLPKLKAMAPEFYDNLKSHGSYTKLVLQFIFSQEVGMFSRIVRKERGSISLKDNTMPDMKMVQAEAVVHK